MTENFETWSLDHKIRGILTIPDENRKTPCVILSHGLISSKESSKYVTLSERLVKEGIAACRFDYHGCGESEGSLEETTLTIRVDNLDSVTDYVLGHPSINNEKIAILGSSFGGSTCIVKAAKDKRIRCISLWATPHRIEKKDGGRISEVEFKDSLFNDFSSYDLVEDAKRLSCALVVHGDMDEVVPFQEGKAVYKSIAKPKKLAIIKGADHIFSDPYHREKVIDMATNWFRRYLLGP